MFTKATLAILLTATAASMLAQPAAARDTGLFGDTRSRCASFVRSAWSPYRPQIMAYPQMPRWSVYWDKQTGREESFRGTLQRHNCHYVIHVTR